MKITFLKNTALTALLVAGLSFTSCKKETTEETTVETTDTTTVETDGMDNEMLDEEGAKDTMSVTTDTVVTVKP